MISMNTYGHFSEDGLEYIITDPHPPRDWYNFFWNDTYLACAGQHMNGFSLFQSEEGVVTNLFGKQDERDAPRALYLRDHDTGEVWSAAYLPCATEIDFFECRHGLGYTVLTTEKNGIRVQHRVFVPLDESGEVWTITLENLSDHPRNISLFSVSQIMLDGINMPYGYLGGLQASFLPDDNTLFFANTTYTVVDERYRAFMYSDRPIEHWDVSREHFLGKTRNMAFPERVTEGQLSDSVASVEPLIGAIQHTLALLPQAKETLHIVLGLVRNQDEAQKMICSLQNADAIDAAFEAMRRFHLDRIQNLELQTPDIEFNRLFNVWFKHQLYLMADWARFYFKGYRDTCQDAAGLAITDSERATAMLLKALSHQRSDGFAPRAFRVASMDIASANKHYADSPSWISLTTEAILNETGDFSIFDTIAPYSDGGEATVWEHNLQAMEFLWNDRGEHGLSLMHSGDWCDLMDKVGPEGRGESVWMSMALAAVLRRMEKMADWRNELDVADTCRKRHAELKKSILKHAWDETHFISAINDDGKRYGANDCIEGRYFINPQSWAMLGDVIDAETYTQIATHIETEVDTPAGPVHCWPPFEAYDPGIGQLSGTPAGFFTNGNVYCHAAAFKIAADYAAGRSDKAFDTFKRILPDAARGEPFAQVNGYVGPTANRMVHHVSDDPWRTGTVAWNFVNAVTNLLGFKAEPKGVRLVPQLPDHWDTAAFKRPFRGIDFYITIHRGPKPGIAINGEPISGDFIAMPPEGFADKSIQVDCVIAHHEN